MRCSFNTWQYWLIGCQRSQKVILFVYSKLLRVEQWPYGFSRYVITHATYVHICDQGGVFNLFNQKHLNSKSISCCVITLFLWESTVESHLLLVEPYCELAPLLSTYGKWPFMFFTDDFILNEKGHWNLPKRFIDITWWRSISNAKISPNIIRSYSTSPIVGIYIQNQGHLPPCKLEPNLWVENFAWRQ